MLKQNITYFKERVSEYDVDYVRDDERFLMRTYFIKPQAATLVLGCGAGRLLQPLYDHGLQVSGIDIVPEMVETARRRVADLPVTVEVMDAANLQFANSSFDYVFFPFHGIDCLYPNVWPAVREAARVLNSEGIFILNSHNRWFIKQLPRSLWRPYLLYDGAKLYQATPLAYFRLKRYFRNVRIRYRISLQSRAHSNWKDRCYQTVPFLSISMYFICRNPRS